MYLGREPVSGEVIVLDSIESQFNGSLTTFNLTRQFGTSTVPFYPVSSEQLLVSLGGVIQRPDRTGNVGFYINTDEIVFAVAPPAGTSCFIVSYGNITDIGTPADNSVTTTKIADGSVTPVKLSTGGPYWDTSGNLGIGTTNPTTLLNVSDQYNTDATVKTVALLSSNNPVLSGAGARIFFGSVNALTRGVALVGLNTGGGNNAHDMVFEVGAPSSAPTERMRLTNAGNLGIGTSSPSEKLEVVGNVKASRLISNVAQGTAPLTVTSTTVVTNLNADLLDGQQGSYYLNTSTAFGGDVSGTYNAIVVADDSHNHIISNVDGLQTALDGKLSTSGKAADSNLLDGLDSGSFLRSDTGDSLNVGRGDVYIENNSSDNIDGAGITIRTSVNPTSTGGAIFAVRSSGQANRFWVGQDFTSSGYNPFYVGTSDSINPHSTPYIILPVSGNITRGGNIVWDAGNDGSGSGLDADLLDGLDSASFLRSDANDSASGTYTFSGGGSDISNTPTFNLTAGYISVSHDEVLLKFDEGQKMITSNDDAGNFNIRAGHDNNQLHVSSSSGNSGMSAITLGSDGIDGEIHLYVGPQRAAGSSATADYGLSIERGISGLSWRTGSDIYGGNLATTYTIWHAGNDGSGSGLDADLLDGQQGSYYQPASTALTTSTTFGGDVSGTYNAIVVANDSHTHDSRYYTETESNTRYFRRDSSNDVDVRLASGNGRGLRFWDSDNYKIWMSATTDATWGGRLDSTSDYNMYFRMTGGTNRGFVFQNSTTEVFQIESTGQVRTASNNIYANGNLVWHAGNDGPGSTLDADTLDGSQKNTLVASLRANHNITGGGTITFNSSGYLINSQRFIVISNGRGSHFSTAGYFDIQIPTSGTIIGVGGASNKTATSDGIPLDIWEALYYILPIGSNNAPVAANFRVCRYTSDLEIPETWLLVAIRNGDSGQKCWVMGKYGLEPGESIDTTTYDAKNADLLDGLDSTQFLRSDAASTGTGLITLTNGLNVTGGNVGIGTSTPQYNLDVNGNINFTGTFYQNGTQFVTSRWTSGTGDDIYRLNGNVGIGTSTPTNKLEVNGSFAATTKSFVIPHPTKEGMKLRYGSLEGPENGVYVRGKTTESIIPLPEYWTGLVDEETITVNLTSKNGKLHSVVKVIDNTVEIKCVDGDVDCYFMILGERKDVDKLKVEY